MTYIDGFVAAVKTADKESYRVYAQRIGSLFKEYGALDVIDCWGDDVPEGKVTSFPLAVKREDGETVVLGWVNWPSRAVRDEAWKKLMADPRMQPGATAMPFDGKRMIFGGFEMISKV
jgi:uncharacterized protein YbaA (DUF1428 family)